MSKKEELKRELEEILSEVKDINPLTTDSAKKEKRKELWQRMVDKAVKLHKIVNPKHHSYMIKNRSVDPEDDPKRFYNHIHPVEDLIAYMYDEHANDEVEDKTIGESFKFEVYSKRQGHTDEYQFIRTENGWEISFMTIGGECDKTGSPYLYENFKQDFIEYPNGFPGYLEWLWYKAKEDGLNKQEVQFELNKLADWVTKCEEEKPDSGLWSNY